MSMRLGTLRSEGFVLDREISADEYQLFRQSMISLGPFINYQHLFTFARANYDDFTDAAMNFLQEYSNSRVTHLGLQQKLLITFELNRKLSNFLSSFLSYTDHTRQSLLERFGKDSIQYKRYETAFLNERDNNFSFGLIRELRNMAQHQTMPIAKIELTSKSLDTVQQDWQHRLDVFACRDQILSNEKLHKKNPSLWQEIAQLPLGYRTEKMS